MFLTVKGLKGLMKDAYTGTGLTIGNFNEEYMYLESGYWSVWIKKGFIPKEIRAYMIELGGEYPDTGTAYTCHKKEDNQMVLCPKWNILEEAMETHEDVRITRTLVELHETPCRLLQTVSGTVMPVIDKAVQTVGKPSKEDYGNGECDCGNPMSRNDKQVFWFNNVCYYMVWKSFTLGEDGVNEWLNAQKGVSVW